MKILILVTAMIFSSLCAYSSIMEIRTDEAPQAIKPYSQAVQSGNYLFV